MALYHEWNVKTGFTSALHFFIHISDSLDGVDGVSQLADGSFLPKNQMLQNGFLILVTLIVTKNWASF